MSAIYKATLQLSFSSIIAIYRQEKKQKEIQFFYKDGICRAEAFANRWRCHCETANLSAKCLASINYILLFFIYKKCNI